MTAEAGAHGRPPSVDALARSLARTHPLPHPVLVDCARRAVSGAGTDAAETADRLARGFTESLVGDVINGTGVLLHTNLGRAPLPYTSTGRPSNLEFDLGTGGRGSRHTAVSRLIGVLTGAEDAIVVNNNAAAVMLVLAALARGREVAVSRGESVEIGGGFRIPDVMEQSGARLVDVGTTNRTNINDYSRAVQADGADIALLLKVHPSNFTVSGFTESVGVSALAGLGVPVVSDIGSGLLDNQLPWVTGADGNRLGFLRDEPAARQTLADGASIVMFSGDKLLGGPQCGIIAGKADLIARCASHPLMRALRPGGHTLQMLQAALLSFADRTACSTIPFWSMVSAPAEGIRERAAAVVASTGVGSVVETEALIGAGSVPGSSLPSFGIEVNGDVVQALRASIPPVVARTANNRTVVDLRTVAPSDDSLVAAALRSLR